MKKKHTFILIISIASRFRACSPFRPNRKLIFTVIQFEFSLNWKFYFYKVDIAKIWGTISKLRGYDNLFKLQMFFSVVSSFYICVKSPSTVECRFWINQRSLFGQKEAIGFIDFIFNLLVILILCANCTHFSWDSKRLIFVKRLYNSFLEISKLIFIRL